MKSGSGIESDDEYKVSKALLKAFIEFKAIKQYLTNDGTMAVKQ